MEFKKEKIKYENLSSQERLLKRREKGRNHPDHQQRISHLTAIVRANEKIYVEADDTVADDGKKDEKA